MVVLETLQHFFQVSRQMVSSEKSLLFCFSSVSAHEGDILSRVLGFSLKRDSGRYLGVPLLYKRVNKSTYQQIVDWVIQKLSSWQDKSLSLASGVTLIRAVILTIPFFSMQKTKLTEGIISRIEKVCTKTLGS